MLPVPPEPVGVNPRIDLVFRVALGDPNHLDRLVDFLNAGLPRAAPIVSATLLRPNRAAEHGGLSPSVSHC